MAFEATKRELGELYTFFRLLANGKVSLGTPQARKDETKCWPVALIQREEHDGTRRYYIEQGNVPHCQWCDRGRRGHLLQPIRRNKSSP